MKIEIRKVRDDLLQITSLDERFYKVGDEEKGEEVTYFPSVTWVLDYFPKDKFFTNWLKANGEDADNIRDAAADRGNVIHNAITHIERGNELRVDTLLNGKEGARQMTGEEIEAVFSYLAWKRESGMQTVLADETVVSRELGVAGTLDLFMEDEEAYWLIDVKTGKTVVPSYHSQVAVYKHGLFEDMPEGLKLKKDKPVKLAILQVGYTMNKKKFKFTEVEDEADALLDFKMAYHFWKRSNDGKQPKQYQYPLVLAEATAPKK
jgi:hypothetical protein